MIGDDDGYLVPDDTEECAEEEISDIPVVMRKLTDADVTKYDAMIEDWLRRHILKNWNEADAREAFDEVSLGNTGWTVRDFRQHLKTEVCVALLNYDPNYRTAEGASVKESTFVFNHLRFRVGQLMKKLTKKGYGYGRWHVNLEEILWETDKD